MQNLYVHYGCGLDAPNEWINFDASPTFRIQQIPILGNIVKKKLNVIFPPNVKFGNIVHGLPIASNSCAGVYCSHTLEHLSLQDFRQSLKNTLNILQKDGIFRCVVPDLEYAANLYIQQLNSGDEHASIHFIGNTTLLGINQRPKGFKGLVTSLLGNSHHLWMWDAASLKKELSNAGFTSIRTCTFNDCEDKMFTYVEREGRFVNAVAIECKK